MVLSLAALLMLGSAGTAMGDVISLQDLIDGTVPSVVSYDGSVEFTNFSYTPTVGAPSAEEINVITDADLPNGIKVQGAFQAFDGRTMDMLFGYDAALTGGGEMTEASMDLVLAEARGISVDDPTIQSSVSIIENIDSIDLSPPTAELFVYDKAAPGEDILTDMTALDGFGSSVHVLKDIGLVTIPADLTEDGISAAAFSLFTQSFVPEPATWALLAGTPILVLLRRRR
jgi:hypothetical protein